MEPVAIPTEDGFSLGGSWFPAEGADTAVVVSSATAVPRRLYDDLARYFQASGWSVLTYDYRGVGGSRPATLRGFPATMRDWALLDVPAAFRWVRAEHRPRRVFAIGHSFGGQVLGLLPEPSWVDAAVFVSVQSGYWGVQAPRDRLRSRFLTTAVLPPVSRLFGYFPWSRFMRGEDLPAGVAIEWARWCRQRRYLLDDRTLPLERYVAFRAPILAYSVDDDDWGTAASVDEMMSAYPHVERAHLVPAEHGLRSLGHMGYFRRASAALWPLARAWLDAAPTHPPPNRRSS